MPSNITLSPHLHTFFFTHPLDYMNEWAVVWMRKLQRMSITGGASKKRTRRIEATPAPEQAGEIEEVELGEWV